MLRDIDADTVDFGPNYDERTREPLLLPSRFPNLLVNGAAGIAVGMATNIPPHNLREVTGAVTAYIEDPEVDLNGLMKHVKGPDFPGGGIIMGRDGIRDAYASGRGSVRVRARAHVEPLKGGKEAIIVTELPFQVKKGGEGGLITKIADLVRDKKITGISDLRDESDRSGMRIVIELKRGGDPAKVVLNQLYKRTQMQQSFGINMVALVDGVPRTLSLLEAIRHYVVHQRDVITRRTQHELARAEARAHILEGLLVALDNLDAVIKLIRGSKDPDIARDGLIEKFTLTRPQAQAILDMRLQRLTALEADKIREEHAELSKRIKELRAILADETKVLGLVKSELAEIAERYGDDRRTEITAAEGELDIEDVIADEQMVVSITASGYAKRTPLTTYRQQRRGGRGVQGMNMKEGDYIEHLHVCSTHDYLLFFTNQGKVYRLKVYELPEGSRASRGRALVNVLPLKDQEKVMAVIPTRDFSEGKFLVFGTAQGMVKKTPFKDYDTPIRADGIIAINIRKGDELVRVRMTSGKDDIIMTSKSGHAARFSEKQARPMGRATAGVKGMNVSDKGNRGPLPRRRRSRGYEGRSAGRHRERLRQADAAHRVPGQGPRREGNADGEADRQEGRPRRRPRRARTPGAHLHLPARDGAAQRRRGHLPDGKGNAGRAGDEPEEGRPRQRGGARCRVRERKWQWRRGRGPVTRGRGTDRGQRRRGGRRGGVRRQRRGEGIQEVGRQPQARRETEEGDKAEARRQAEVEQAGCEATEAEAKADSDGQAASRGGAKEAQAVIPGERADRPSPALPRPRRSPRSSRVAGVGRSLSIEIRLAFERQES